MENSMKQEEFLQYMKDAIEVETDLATQEQTLERSLAEIEKKDTNAAPGRHTANYSESITQKTS